MKITHAEIIRLRGGCDYVVLYTDLPSAFPQYPKEVTTLRFNAPRETGKSFVEQHFPDVKVTRIVTESGELPLDLLLV